MAEDKCCHNCGKRESQWPTIMKGGKWCSENCRKAIEEEGISDMKEGMTSDQEARYDALAGMEGEEPEWWEDAGDPGDPEEPATMKDVPPPVAVITTPEPPLSWKEDEPRISWTFSPPDVYPRAVKVKMPDSDTVVELGPGDRIFVKDQFVLEDGEFKSLTPAPKGVEVGCWKFRRNVVHDRHEWTTVYEQQMTCPGVHDLASGKEDW